MDCSDDHSTSDDAAHIIKRLKRNDPDDTSFHGWDDQAALWTNEAYARIQNAVLLNTVVETVSVATVYEDSYMMEEAGNGVTRVAQTLSCFNRLRDIQIGHLLDVPFNYDYHGIAANVDVLLRGLAQNPNANLKVFTTTWSGGSEAITEVLNRFRELEEFSLGCNEMVYCRLTQDFAQGIAASLPNLRSLKKVVLQCTLNSVSYLEPILYSLTASRNLNSLRIAFDSSDTTQSPSFRRLLDATARLITSNNSPLKTVGLSFMDGNYYLEREVPSVDMSSFMGHIVKSKNLHFELELSGCCCLNPGEDVLNALVDDSSTCTLTCLKLYNIVLRGRWATLLSRFKCLETLVIDLEFEHPSCRREDPQVWEDLLDNLPLLKTFKYLDYAKQRQRDSAIFAGIARGSRGHPSLRHTTLHIGKDDSGECQKIPELRDLLVDCKESFHLALPNSDAENVRFVIQGIIEAKNLFHFSLSPRERLHQDEWCENLNGIIGAVGQSKSLQEFDVDNVYAWWGDNGVPPKQSALLVTALRENTTLRHCDLASNCQSKEDEATIRFQMQLNRFGRYLLELSYVPLGLWPLVLCGIACSEDDDDAAHPAAALFFFLKGVSTSVFD